MSAVLIATSILHPSNYHQNTKDRECLFFMFLARLLLTGTLQVWTRSAGRKSLGPTLKQSLLVKFRVPNNRVIWSLLILPDLREKDKDGSPRILFH